MIAGFGLQHPTNNCKNENFFKETAAEHKSEQRTTSAVLTFRLRKTFRAETIVLQAEKVLA